jgi:hypothetical protein
MRLVSGFFLARSITLRVSPMNVYCVSYDLKKPGQDYEPLYEQLKKSLGWWHYLDSTWLISTFEDAQTLASRLLSVIDANDRLLVIRVSNERQGWLPKDAWDWIALHV